MKKYILFAVCPFLFCEYNFAQTDTICKTNNTNYLSCEQSNEPKYLSSCQSVAARNGNSLAIKLTNKKTLTFSNTALDSILLNYDSVKNYILKKYYKVNNIAVMERITVNGTMMLVTNLNTGKKVETNWLPVFSPDNRRFAVVSGTEFNTYSAEKVEVYINKNGNYIKEFGFKPDGALSYLGTCKWQGNDQIAVKRVNYAKTNQSGKPLKSDITLAIIDNKWSVTGK